MLVWHSWKVFIFNEDFGSILQVRGQMFHLKDLPDRLKLPYSEIFHSLVTQKLLTDQLNIMTLFINQHWRHYLMRNAYSWVAWGLQT